MENESAQDDLALAPGEWEAMTNFLSKEGIPTLVRKFGVVPQGSTSEGLDTEDCSRFPAMKNERVGEDPSSAAPACEGCRWAVEDLKWRHEAAWGSMSGEWPLEALVNDNAFKLKRRTTSGQMTSAERVAWEKKRDELEAARQLALDAARPSKPCPPHTCSMSEYLGEDGDSEDGAYESESDVPPLLEPLSGE
ncbi:unnamed protein product [Peniophora sp. CBMAI 1063]|nr:unnamed protein product [Peniophora sp. CBMAI 1063]